MQLNEVIEILLGHKGRVCSWSKSCGPAMAIYNSNVVMQKEGEDPELIWYGDIVLEEALISCLTNLADKLGVEIMVFYEHPIRIFQFTDDEEEIAKAVDIQKSLINNRNGLVWTSLEPYMFDDMSYVEARERREKRREENIRQRQISYGMVTPRGTRWAWYNKWFYKGPYKIYKILDRFCYNFMWFPYKMGFRYSDGLKWTQKLTRFFKIMRKEFYYQRFEGGLFHFWVFKLFQNQEKN